MTSSQSRQTRRTLASTPDRAEFETGTTAAMDPAAPTWIFGYGSLVWRPAFPYAERRPARIEGWTRRFWQGSIDHRGVPGAPGRVVTLIPQSDALCHGVAYRISTQQRAEALQTLDHRERGGYSRHQVQIQLDMERAQTTRRVAGWIYVADEGNPNYLGPASLEEIARVARHASGPSGPNVEYVLELAQALRAMGVWDDAVMALERLLCAAPR